MVRPKHRTRPGATYFITTNTWERRAIFRESRIAAIVKEAIFRYRDAGHYKLDRYVVMPDHIHVLLTPGASTSLEKAIQLIKGGSSHDIGENREKRLPIWQASFTEHQVRDVRDFGEHVAYIDQNPVKARLAENAHEYLHSSASGRFVLDPWHRTSGAEAHTDATVSAGLKPRPSIGGRT